MRLHLLANSHLDPVWLWDWQEGLNEGIATCRTALQLMDEFPELTFLRGESSVYGHLAQHDPATMERIAAHVAQGRWDVVGGTWCQPDTNLPSTEVLCRQFAEGLSFFRREFNVRPTAAWLADSFGHSRGWPEIMAAAGMQSFAFSRPSEADCPLPGPAFWWRSASGARILCWRVPIGWYGSDRGDMPRRLDAYHEAAGKWGLENVAVFFGLGNHGGGPTRADLREIVRWREANPGVQVEFSTLHRFFDELRREADMLSVFDGELNFTMRGCYSTAARLKFAYRRAENALLAAERTTSVLSAAFGTPVRGLDEAWATLMLTTFHDVLPGTAIERALDEQHSMLGVVAHQAQCTRLDALNALAARLDTRVAVPAEDMPAAVPVLLWNPHPSLFAGCVEIEASLDYRPIRAYRGRPDALPVTVRDHRGEPLPFQLTGAENHFAPEVPWRKRFVVPVRLPAMGWKIVQVAWDEFALPQPPPPSPACAHGQVRISNEFIDITAAPGRTGISVNVDGAPLFGRTGLRTGTFDDPFGSWGGHDDEIGANDISTLLHTWRVRQTAVLEGGPHRAVLWVQLGAGASRFELTIQLERGARVIRFSARLLWNERNARLKLIFPGGCKRAEFEVPGGAIRRGPLGEVAGGRWVRMAGGAAPWIFSSDALYNYDVKRGAFRATVVRSTRYAWNAASQPSQEPWRPHTDLGEHRFQFAIAAGEMDPWQVAARLEQPTQVLLTHPHRGAAEPAGSLMQVPGNVRLLAVKRANDQSGWIVRLQVIGTVTAPIEIVWLGKPLSLGFLNRWTIASWRLEDTPTGWVAHPVNSAEETAAPSSVGPVEQAPRKTKATAPRRGKDRNRLDAAVC
jgi:alpha-mannosidase